MKATYIVNKLGIPNYQKGYKALALAIELASRDSELLHCAMKKLYPEVARQLGCTSEQVQRNIRSSINTCWKNENHEFIDMLARYPLTKRPRPLALIGWGAEYLEWANSKGKEATTV